LGLVPQWALVNGILLLVFNFWDQWALDREEKARAGSLLDEVQHHRPLSVSGGWNFLFLGGVVAVIYLAGVGFGNGGAPWAFGVQEGLMAAFAALAYLTTAPALRRENRFGFAPIVEVAVLFAGIFVTMTPALLVLNAWGLGEREVFGLGFGLTRPAHFYW